MNKDVLERTITLLHNYDDKLRQTTDLYALKMATCISGANPQCKLEDTSLSIYADEFTIAGCERAKVSFCIQTIEAMLKELDRQ